jgi:hypothetical protein
MLLQTVGCMLGSMPRAAQRAGDIVGTVVAEQEVRTNADPDQTEQERYDRPRPKEARCLNRSGQCGADELGCISVAVALLPERNVNVDIGCG